MRSTTAPLADLTGRVCVVTGASRGIGRAVAEQLGVLGATLVLICRRAEDGEAVAEAIAGDTRAPLPEVVTADLSIQSSVRAAAAVIRERHAQIHVLINNAGVIVRQREVTVDGLEHQFAVNHLAYFLITRLLLDRLEAGAPSRIVNLSSGAHQGGTLDLNDLQSERRYDPVRVYGRTKLANILFTYELARRLEGTGVTVNCVHPGVIGTKLLSDYMNVPVVGGALARTFGASPEKAATAIVHLAASPEVERVTGTYFDGRRVGRSSPASYDEALARRLWDASERLTGLAGVATP
ncbi:MAG TPA: SDR family oxidoreductase [Gemmatimonadales bacterium]|jgi:NAD(P)-dependent dehydrogenase (short-subunit alcohol dehydrogenase family)|nr:SDR family oxidoreductase [Gemmatimonadales bacterium]